MGAGFVDAVGELVEHVADLEGGLVVCVIKGEWGVFGDLPLTTYEFSMNGTSTHLSDGERTCRPGWSMVRMVRYPKSVPLLATNYPVTNQMFKTNQYAPQSQNLHPLLVPCPQQQQRANT